MKSNQLTVSIVTVNHMTAPAYYIDHKPLREEPIQFGNTYSTSFKCDPKNKRRKLKKMSVTPEDLVRVLAIITSETKIQLATRHRMKGSFLTGAGVTIGGVCGGPVGIVIGGLLGGTVAAWRAKETRTDVEEFLTNMNREQRQDLYNYMRYLVDECRVKNFVGLNAKVATDPELKRRFQDVFLCYLKNELKLHVV